MILALVTTLGLGGAVEIAPLPTVTTYQGAVLSAGSESVTGPHTNSGAIYYSNAVTSATATTEFGIVWPASATLTGMDIFTPEIATMLNGRTVWGTSGIWRARASFLVNGRPTATTLALNCAPSSGSYNLRTFTNFVADTLGAVCRSNLLWLTNAGRTANLWASWGTNGWTWDTNSLLYGATGYTGLSQCRSPGGYLGRMTAITPRHCYTSGHVAAGVGTVVYFVGTDGLTNSRTITAVRTVWDSTGDYNIALLDSDLPATVQPVVTASNVTAKLPGSVGFAVPLPLLSTCQHGRVGSVSTPLYDSHNMSIGGDSGNPAFIILSNTVVNYGLVSGGYLLASNFMADLNALTSGAGLNTNDYQPTIWTLDAFPDL